MIPEEFKCPITDCATITDYDDEMIEHLINEHDFIYVAGAVLDLMKQLASAKANTECQRCGNYGATPDDHPLCDSCKAEVYG